MKRLNGNQTNVLQLLAERGTWKAGCGWEWGSAHRTDNILSSLVPRGLATKVGESQSFGIYEITPTGRTVASTRA